MITVYLDTSVYNRPFDDQTQPKIFLETQAVTLILQMAAAQLINLVGSSVLDYENSLNPFPIKQKAMNRYLQMATIRQQVDETIRQRAEQLEQQGIKAIDALHVACAEATNSDYFITCDKRLINRCQGFALKTLNPVDFILEIEDDNKSNDQQALQDGLDVLIAHLEPAKLARFVAACKLGEGDYIKSKDKLFAQETVASLYEKVKAYQDSTNES